MEKDVFKLYNRTLYNFCDTLNFLVFSFICFSVFTFWHISLFLSNYSAYLCILTTLSIINILLSMRTYLTFSAWSRIREVCLSTMLFNCLICVILFLVLLTFYLAYYFFYFYSCINSSSTLFFKNRVYISLIESRNYVCWSFLIKSPSS